MFKKIALYIIICVCIYLLLFTIDVYILKPVVDYFGEELLNYILVYNTFLFVINPIITKILADKIININIVAPKYLKVNPLNGLIP